MIDKAKLRQIFYNAAQLAYANTNREYNKSLIPLYDLPDKITEKELVVLIQNYLKAACLHDALYAYIEDFDDFDEDEIVSLDDKWIEYLSEHFVEE